MPTDVDYSYLIAGDSNIQLSPGHFWNSKRKQKFDDYPWGALTNDELIKVADQVIASTTDENITRAAHSLQVVLPHISDTRDLSPYYQEILDRLHDADLSGVTEATSEEGIGKAFKEHFNALVWATEKLNQDSSKALTSIARRIGDNLDAQQKTNLLFYIMGNGLVKAPKRLSQENAAKLPTAVEALANPNDISWQEMSPSAAYEVLARAAETATKEDFMPTINLLNAALTHGANPRSVHAATNHLLPSMKGHMTESTVNADGKPVRTLLLETITRTMHAYAASLFG